MCIKHYQDLLNGEMGKNIISLDSDEIEICYFKLVISIVNYKRFHKLSLNLVMIQILSYRSYGKKHKK